MNGNGCVMSPNINVLKQNSPSPMGMVDCATPSRNVAASPDTRVKGRVLANSQCSPEFSTPDRSCSGLTSVPEDTEVNSDSARDPSKSKYHACSSSTPIKYLHRTPPSRNRTVVVTNPFDVGITERLSLPVYSPSVFAQVVSPNQESPTFRWNIDNLSKIYPADIEEFPNHQYEEALDPEMESKAQEAINRFFCKSQQLLPSPWGPRPNANALRTIASNCGTPQTQVTPASSDRDVEEEHSLSRGKPSGKDVWTQTILTLPPILPPSVELALKPFFTFTMEQQQCQNNQADSSSEGDEGVLSTSSLRRKLFFHSESPPPIATSSNSNQSNMNMSLGCASSPSCSQSIINAQGRTFGSPIPMSKVLSPPCVSPINSSGAGNRSKSATRLNFNQEDMTLDVSMCATASGTAQMPSQQTGAAPLQDKDTDDESNEQIHQNNKWSRRNKRNSMDISANSSLLSQGGTPVKSMDTSMQNVMDISQSKLISRANTDRENGVNYNDEGTFAYSHSVGISQDTGYASVSSYEGFQSGTTSLFGHSISRDKMNYEDSLATWQPRNVVSSTPTKTPGRLGTNYRHD